MVMTLRPATKASVEPVSGGSAVSGSVWDKSGTNAIKSSLAAARNPPLAPSGAPTGPRGARLKSTLGMNVQTPSDVAVNLGKLNVDGPQTQD